MSVVVIQTHNFYSQKELDTDPFEREAWAFCYKRPHRGSATRNS